MLLILLYATSLQLATRHLWKPQTFLHRLVKSGKFWRYVLVGAMQIALFGDGTRVVAYLVFLLGLLAIAGWPLGGAPEIVVALVIAWVLL